jgi:hypothetical protein
LTQKQTKRRRKKVFVNFVIFCSKFQSHLELPFPLVMGIDSGRRHDLTVAWTLRQVGDVQQTVEVSEMHRTPTPEQVERLRPRLRQARRGRDSGNKRHCQRNVGQGNGKKILFLIPLTIIARTSSLHVFDPIFLTPFGSRQKDGGRKIKPESF